LATTPPDSAYFFKYSSSLERSQKIFQPAAVTDNKDRNTSALKIITFAKNDNIEGHFVFTKEKVPKQGLLSYSGLSEVRRPPKGIDINLPALHLMVFVNLNAGPLPNKVNVKIVPNATVEQLIDVVVRQLNVLLEKTRVEDAIVSPINPKACQLMLAEEDGRPDVDTPVLQRDVEIHRFGCTSFALCKDPDYNMSEVKPTLKVMLPSKEYQVLSLNNTLTVRHVLEKVCRKRLLDPLVHYLVSSKDPSGPDLDLDKCIDDLDTNEMILRVKSQRRQSMITRISNNIGSIGSIRSKSKCDLTDTLAVDITSAPQPVHSKVTQKLGLPPQYFFSPAMVAQYVEYTVIKINKYGKRQERIMGIDGERITNCLPPNSKAGKTHRPFRPITTVSRAYVVDKASQPPTAPLGGMSTKDQKKQFCIEYNDGVCVYESDKADAIVSRINFILSMDNSIKA